ncbi:hypothetical protein K461DRAFT_267824 [Myriangium duriaei CBS 260.36]|uniref:Uncharacterized protein n=1 Tax=Myriangium duriaei CBS 260.36 TaxID=1168546 RepID=A0A9P4J0F5_9PEZI|nr:hypothetical protein K461DRAFT_267824 [Myriangium duriaei CBS 260.36]
MSSDSSLETVGDRTDAGLISGEMVVESSGLPSPEPETLLPSQALVQLADASPKSLSPTPESLPSPSSEYSSAVVSPAESTSPDTSKSIDIATVKIIMPDSLSSAYGDSDYSSDNDSIFEMQCCQARAVRFLHPGKPSVVDLMRAEKPTFKRASQVVVRRPLSRPFISPVQPKRLRRSSTESKSEASGSEASYSPRNRTSRSSIPTTPTLDDDEGSSSMTSDASPSSPETPRSSFEQDRRCFEAYKESPEPLVTQSLMSDLPTVTDIKQKFRRPSRLRLFPKRSISINSGSEGEMLKATPQLPPMILESASKSTGDVFTVNTPRPWLTDVGTKSPQLPPSPALSNDQPLTAKLIPSRSLWRDAGRPRFLRRVESRVGLNTAH